MPLVDETTIVAIATAPGRGGIGVVRISGPQALAIAQSIAKIELTARHAHYTILQDETGARIDDAVITYFAAPSSYTGEDVVEIATHGSPIVLDWLVRAAVAAGAQPARPGEFTERAFLRGRLDLTQAEAVRDLIDAQTLGQAQQAAAQMGGAISSTVRPIKQQLIALIAALEAGIDFAEDDLDTLPAAEIATRIEALLPPLEKLLTSFAHGRVLREGLRLAIVGRPNAGKSSLFNRLVERDRAIVTATPGTTRDVIAERISIGGVPVELLDTAGLRETDDEAERMGVARSHEAIAEADAVLLVLDASSHDAALDSSVIGSLHGRPVIVAHNKIDLLRTDVAVSRNSLSEPTAQASANEIAPRPNVDEFAAQAHVRTSATTGEGIAELREALLHVTRAGAEAAGAATLTNLRQRDAVQRAVDAATRAHAATATATPHEMLLLDLYEALRALDELTGETTADDVLNLIFSTFCIGK